MSIKTISNDTYIGTHYRYVENTGSVLQALALFTKLYPNHRKKEIEYSMAKAAHYLEQSQCPNGGWCVMLYLSHFFFASMLFPTIHCKYLILYFFNADSNRCIFILKIIYNTYRYFLWSLH